jgi:glycosyltransferase involved in cell wall biosynthesis
MSLLPTVSVCIPAYRTASGLEQAVRSVLGQSFMDWELILSINGDDAEIESVKERIRNVSTDPRIRIAPCKDKISMADHWNRSIALASGEFLKLLCQDDLMVPDCLDRQISALRGNPSASVASGSRIIINGAGKKLFVRNAMGASGLYPGKSIIRRCIMAGTNIIGDPVNVMWRRSAMEKVGLFDPSIVYCTDVEYWLRLLGVGDLSHDSVPTGFYRIHGAATTAGMAGVTVEDFLRTARLQQQMGSVMLSRRDEAVIRLKSTLQNTTRQWIYKLMGG